MASGCTAYDCEFVVLAKDLDVKLITLDRAVLKAFPDVARSLGSQHCRRLWETAQSW